MRESFVFHEDFIRDLPEEYAQKFTAYAVQYGLYGVVPPIEKNTLEYALWAKIARRIDEDTQKYREISEKRREAALKRHRKYGNAGDENADECRSVDETRENPSGSPCGRKEEPEKNARFEKPTVEEVREYCIERNNGIDAQAFWDFYEAKGWLIGKNLMKDWRACVRNWESRRKSEEGVRKKPGAIWGNENTVPESYLNIM